MYFSARKCTGSSSPPRPRLCCCCFSFFPNPTQNVWCNCWDVNYWHPPQADVWLMGQKLERAGWARVCVCVYVWHPPIRLERRGKRSTALPVGGAVSPSRGLQQASRGVPVHPCTGAAAHADTNTQADTQHPAPPCWAARRVWVLRGLGGWLGV